MKNSSTQADTRDYPASRESAAAGFIISFWRLAEDRRRRL
jgi:hypothetical protein